MRHNGVMNEISTCWHIMSNIVKTLSNSFTKYLLLKSYIYDSYVCLFHLRFLSWMVFFLYFYLQTCKYRLHGKLLNIRLNAKWAAEWKYIIIIQSKKKLNLKYIGYSNYWEYKLFINSFESWKVCAKSRYTCTDDI